MSVIGLAAELIRHAAIDENYARDLDEAVDDDEQTATRLIFAPLGETDLRFFNTAQLLWFAYWRQQRGGLLDRPVLDRLEADLSVGSRLARFRLRGLVQRDPQSVVVAGTLSSARGRLSGVAAADDSGLQWLLNHARTYRDSREVARDSLQFATPASWFTLRVLTSPEHGQSDAVREELALFAEVNGVPETVTSQWFVGPNETFG